MVGPFRKKWVLNRIENCTVVLNRIKNWCFECDLGISHFGFSFYRGTKLGMFRKTLGSLCMVSVLLFHVIQFSAFKENYVKAHTV